MNRHSFRAYPQALVSVVGVLLFAFAASASAATDGDERDSFEASAYFGIGIDTFAAPELSKYLNPDDGNDIKERGVGGIDFAFRVFRKESESFPWQLWVFGETVHGVRSADVDVTDAAVNGKFRGFDVSSPGAKTLYIIRNATSLEAFGGARLEVGAVGDGENIAHPYLFAEGGGLSIAGGTGDVMDAYDAGGGLAMVGGSYMGSFLQLGFGWNDVFHEQPSERWKLDAFLTWSWKEDHEGLRPFVEFCADADMKDGPDALQTYVGVAFDPSKLFGN